MSTNRRSFLSKLSLSGLAIGSLGISNIFAKSNVAKGDKVLVHQVYFWLKKDITPAQKSIFDKGVKSLIANLTVKYGVIEKPTITTDKKKL